MTLFVGLGHVELDTLPFQEGWRSTSEVKPGTERTEFQVLYDDKALYVAGMCYDSRPDSITAGLTRRDDRRESDFFQVNLDPHHDHQTGALFTVSPSGSVGDGIFYNDGLENWTWDGVWETRTRVRSRASRASHIGSAVPLRAILG